MNVVVNVTAATGVNLASVGSMAQICGTTSGFAGVTGITAGHGGHAKNCDGPFNYKVGENDDSVKLLSAKMNGDYQRSCYYCAGGDHSSSVTSGA